MDYNGPIERLKFPIWQDIEEPDSTLLSEAATAITDLLARVEAAEARVCELETSFRTEKCENGPECVELGRVRKALAEAEGRAEKAERERDESQQEALFCRNGWKKAERERDAYKIFFEDVSSKPDCNTCCLKQCEYRPEIGQTTRFNCPLWRGKKEE